MCMEIGLIKMEKEHVAKFETVHDDVSVTFVLSVSENIEKLSKKERERIFKNITSNMNRQAELFFNDLLEVF